MFQISTIQLKTLLKAACKFIVNVRIFFRLNLLNDGLWGTSCQIIFKNAMSFKVFYQLENLTPVWKGVEIELPSGSCLNNLESPAFRNMSSQKGLWLSSWCNS